MITLELQEGNHDIVLSVSRWLKTEVQFKKVKVGTGMIIVSERSDLYREVLLQIILGS